MTDIVNIDPKEFGLEESKALDISNQFKPMLDKMVELEKEYNTVITLPIEELETSKKAKELRLKYVKVRTGTAEIHKAQKAFYLSAGRYIDGWKNTQLFASQGIESKLEEIEKYAENLEKERIKKIQLEREAELQKYGVENSTAMTLGSMPDDVWNNFLVGCKTTYKAKVEAEKLAEQERIAKEEEERERREQAIKENERLKAEAEAKEKALEIERKRVAEEKRIAEEKANKEKAELEARLKAEAEAKEKALAEIESKRLAEEKRIQEEERKRKDEEKARADAEKKLRLAPDKEKLILFAKSLDELSLPELKAEEAQKIVSESKILLTKISNFIREKSSNL